MGEVRTGQFEGGAAFVDGTYVAKADAKISLFDWGFTRSDATYDVASVWKGAFFRLDDHLDRFFASLGKLHLSIPYHREDVRAILHGCVRAAGLKDAYVAMVCTRGVPAPGSRDPRDATNRFYAYALPFVWIAPPEKQAQGIDLHISLRERISPASVDPTVKNYHWLDLVQSLFEAYEHGRDTSCLVDERGNITEGPGFNVFAVREGVVHTAGRGVLEGISRRTAIEICQRLNLPLEVGALPAELLRHCDEAFLTSTGGGILPVAKVDGVPLLRFPGPVTQVLQKAYWALHEEPAHRDPVTY
ncbi:MAG: aminotransferase class IV [Burkholderiaceae bacterium]|jgi:branched-chain amino acid aminotransferase